MNRNMSSAGELRLRGMFDAGFVTFNWQDDGSVEEEILETMRMAVLDLDEVKNILETKIREHNQRSKSFESMKILCNNFNKIIETLLSLWKGTHRLQELHQFPSLTFLEHVMKRCYKNSFRDSTALQAFDKKTFLIIDAVFKHFHLTEDDVLTEICSGSESVILQISASSSFKCCCGIVPNPTAEYENIAAEFTRWMEFYGKEYTEFRLYYEDMMSSEMLKLISDSTVIFLKDLNVESEIKSKVSSVFSQLEGNSRIISFENCSQLFAFSDRTVDVKEYKTEQCDLRYFLHTIKPRSVEATTQMESQSLQSSAAAQMESQSSVAVVQKRRQLPPKSSPPISTPATQKRFKAAGKTKDACKLLSSSEASADLVASLDNILSCYRNQFIKFIEFMQTKEYRLQLGEAVKSELMHKTELKNKIQSLLLQINELNSSSVGTSHDKHGIDTNSDSDLLAEVNTLVTYNRQLKILETLLSNEICRLERREVVEDDLLGLNQRSLLRKAGDCYEKYVQLKEKAKILEAEVAILEGKKENSATSDRQGSTCSSLVFKSALTEHVVRQLPLKFGQAPVADASGTWSTATPPMKSSHSEQQSGVVPFNKGKTSIGLSHQRPKDVDTPSRPPALHLHCPSTSGNSSMVVHGSNGRTEGLMSYLNNDQCSGFSGIGSSGLAKRRGSSSSTDTADSVPGPKHSAQNFEGNSVSAWPNSPVPLQPEVSKFPGHSPKSQQFLKSAMEQSVVMVQSAELRMPHTFSVTPSLSNEMVSFLQAVPEVAPAIGRGKVVSGKRGRRKRVVPDADDGKSKPLSYLGRQGMLTPPARTDTDTGWRLISSEEGDSGLRQGALLESRGLARGFHRGIQHPNEHGYAKSLKPDGTHTTKTDIRKAQDAGNLDALLLAVSLHHLPPSHRNLGQDLAPRTTEMPPQMLSGQLMAEAEHSCSTSFLPVQLSSSSIVLASGQSPLTTLSWSMPRVSGSKPCLMMPNVFIRESPVHAANDKQMETLDDSHGKHFKKRCHSTNLKHYRAKKIGSTADCPNPSTINETTTMPILKSLFSKRNDGASLVPIIQGGGDQLELEHPMHLPNDTQLSTSGSKSTGLQISSRAQSNPTTGTVNQISNVIIPNSEMAQYMKVSCPSAPFKQVKGVSWFSLPLSLIRPVQMSRSVMSFAADHLVSGSDKLLSQSGPVSTTVSNQRTVTSSPAGNLFLSPGISETRCDMQKSSD